MLTFTKDGETIQVPADHPWVNKFRNTGWTEV